MPEEVGQEWLELAKRMLEHRREALDFLLRVRGQFPLAVRAHAAPVVNLWMAADDLDETVYYLLDQMNRELLGDRGVTDSTRGAGMGHLGIKGEALHYNCTWSLEWEEEKRVHVDLAIDPQAAVLFLQVRPSRSGEGAQQLRYPPLDEEELRQALARAFVAEDTVDVCPDLPLVEQRVEPGWPSVEPTGWTPEDWPEGPQSPA